jgi:hypothetical protein
MLQFVVTPAAGKRLIAKAFLKHEAFQSAVHSGTVVIIAGTTNGYVAEEVLKSLGQEEGFARNLFFRGITLPQSQPTSEVVHLPDERKFPGDIVLVKGVWQKGKTIFDVADDLKPGDVILKGANAVDLSSRRAAVLVGHPKGGTIIAALQAVVGRRVKLIIPVGVEKRIPGNLDVLAAKLNDPRMIGPRLLPVPGDIVTELEALQLLTGCASDLSAGGGVCGAEGAVWLTVCGEASQEKAAQKLLEEIAGERPFNLYV